MYLIDIQPPNPLKGALKSNILEPPFRACPDLSGGDGGVKNFIDKKIRICTNHIFNI
jgi:hypothetical protein